MARMEVKKHGLLLAIEGIDGAGKTTQAKRLVRWLRRNGYDARYTSEPTSGWIGRRLKRGSLSSEEMALLFAADRLEHFRKFIEPCLGEGAIVVSDRYVHSSIAYQGAMLGDVEWVRSVNGFAPKPDSAYLLDLEPEEALRRIKRRKDSFERLELLREVCKIYRKLAEDGELVIIDASRPPDGVTEEILRHLKGILQRLRGSG